jgi:hypothetical protein
VKKKCTQKTYIISIKSYTCCSFYSKASIFCCNILHFGFILPCFHPSTINLNFFKTSALYSYLITKHTFGCCNMWKRVAHRCVIKMLMLVMPIYVPPNSSYLCMKFQLFSFCSKFHILVSIVPSKNYHENWMSRVTSQLPC